MGLTPDQIRNLHQSGYPDGVKLSGAWSEDALRPALEIAKVATEATLELENYSTIVGELDQDINTPKNGTKLWQSTDVAWFKKTGKINFLHLTDEGYYFALHVFKPWCHFEFPLKFAPPLAPDVRKFLANKPLKWETESSAWENGTETDPNAQFVFKRIGQISDTHKLVWIGEHKNPSWPGKPFQVNDTVHLEFV